MGQKWFIGRWSDAKNHNKILFKANIGNTKIEQIDNMTIECDSVYDGVS